MAMGKPVIADNSGGPRESILNKETGFLCDDWESYGEAMDLLQNDQQLCERMGEKGYSRVKKMFSFEAFKSQLNKEIVNMKKVTRLQVYLPFLFLFLLIFFLFRH